MNATTDLIQVFLDPGDFHFGGGRTRISTLLGSCVSITLWHPRRRIGGMCHYQVPQRNRPATQRLDGRFADEAFELFLSHIAKADSRLGEYEAKLFGGGNMFIEENGRSLDIARRNVEKGHELLARHGVQAVAEHVGGWGRRKLHFELWSGAVWLAFPEGRDATFRNADDVGAASPAR